LYPLNLKKAEPIKPKLCVGPYMTPEKVYGTSKLEEKFMENCWNFFEFEKKNPPKYENDLRWQTFLATVYLRILHFLIMECCRYLVF